MANQSSNQDDHEEIPSANGFGRKVPALIPAEIEKVAAWFCNLDHEEQAQFFIDVSKIAETWQGQATNQWWWVGREIHLRIQLDKGSQLAANMIACILSGIEPS
jgi:hypothetical protein